MSPEEEFAAIQEQRSILDGRKKLVQKKQVMFEQEEQKSEQGGQPADPNVPIKEIPLDKQSVTEGDLGQLQSVTTREINQLEGNTQKFDSVSGAIQQVASAGINPIREFLGMDPRQAGTYIDPITEWQAEETARRINLSKRGIGSGDPSLGARFVESLAMDDKNRVKAIQKNLNDQFEGKDVEIWVDDETKELLYRNPDDKKIYTANPLGFEFGDVVGYAGDAITASFETAGTALAVVSSGIKKVTGKLTDKQYAATRTRREVGYSAAGAVIGDALKISLGKVFDINDEVTVSEIAIDALEEGAISLGIGTAFEGTKAIIKKIRSVRGDAAIPAHLLDSLKDRTERITNKDFGDQVGGNKVVDIVNDTLRAAQADSVLRPNVGQLLNESDTLDMVASLEKSGTKERRQIIQRQELNESSLVDYFTIIGSDVAPGQPVGKYQLGKDIQGVSSESLEKSRQQAQFPSDQAAQQSEELINKLPVTSQYESAVAVRGAIYEEEEALRRAFTDEYTLLGETARKSGVKSYLTDMKLEIAALDSIETGAKSKQITKEFDKGELSYDSEWSLTKLNNTIKRFNELLGEADIGKSQASTGKIKKTLSILHNAQQELLKDNPDILLKMDALSAAYDDGQSIFNDSIANSIINSKKAIATSDIFNAVIKNSDTSRDVSAAIMTNPEAMVAMKKGVNDLYINDVSKNGIINLEDHKNFVRKYVDTKIITPFFTEKQIKNLSNAGAIAKIYKAEKEKTDQLLTRINKSFEGSISGLGGKELFNKVWTKDAQGSISKLKNILKDRPDVWKNVELEMLDTVKKTIIKGGTISTRSLETLLNNMEGTITEGLGKGYYNGLVTLQKALEVTRRKGVGYNINEESGAAKLLFMYTGRLHKRGKVITEADRLRSVYARKLLTEMVLDPEKLRKFSALKRSRANSDTYKLIMTRLGYRVLTGGGDDGGFRSALNDIGRTAGLVYRRQLQLNNQRDKQLDKEQEKENVERLKFLKNRKKSLDQYSF